MPPCRGTAARTTGDNRSTQTTRDARVPRGDVEAIPAGPPDEADDEDVPAMAAHVFVPIDPQCIEQTPGKQKKEPSPWSREGNGGCVPHGDGPGGQNQKPAFLPIGALRYGDPLGFEGHAAKAPGEGSRCPARLLYTLRCGAFATFPIVLGMIVSGISRLCLSALEPFGELQQEVEIHRTYVSQSVHLFILYFFNMAVLATYLPQEALKLIPLLTGLFAISRLIYWLSYAIGRSFRAFGFSMTFLPLVAMLLWNLYSMFVLEPENLLALATSKPEDRSKDSTAKLRFWG
ncbi:hypothetical protein A306_00000422 [Columba livia]|uniref:Transmembrane protein 79 n=1 Tax=Columba livia TaxID=8932 RepID=A0A2I0LJB0_COLLI|nr:hypothetical protein A306_00000422 [Columba livia]